MPKRSPSSKVIPLHHPPRGVTTVMIGRLVGLGSGAEVEVQLSGEDSPCSASVALDVKRSDVGREVLVTRSQSLNVVVGFLRTAEELAPGRQGHEVRVDGERLVLAADRELELRCGKSSILLFADGRVVVRGEHLLSRATGPNRIRGGSVQIN